jgi:hypothetical protein
LLYRCRESENKREKERKGEPDYWRTGEERRKRKKERKKEREKREDLGYTKLVYQ